MESVVLTFDALNPTHENIVIVRTYMHTVHKRLHSDFQSQQ
jgi:hypothetical protein